MIKLMILLNLFISLNIIAKVPTKLEIITYIKEQCNSERFRINPVIAIAQADVESSFRPHITNFKEKGGIPSRGLFQVKDDTAKTYCGINYPHSLYNYKLNTRCALIYLRYQLDRYNGDYVKALLSYNSGTYYLCKQSHIEQDYDCTVGLPVNFDYINKIYSKIVQ